MRSLSIPALRPHLFAVGGNDAVTRIYDRRFLAPRGGGAPVVALLPEGVPAETAGGGVTGVAFSADGASLLSSHLHGAVHLFQLAQPLGLTAASGHANGDMMSTADAAHAAPQHAPRQAPGVAAALEAAAAAAEAAARGDLEAAREAAEEALEHVASAEAAASTAARVARVAASRLRLARAEALLAAAAGAGLAGGGFEARRLAQAALADAVAAAGLAPREVRRFCAFFCVFCACASRICCTGARSAGGGAGAAGAGPRHRRARAARRRRGSRLERAAAAVRLLLSRLLPRLLTPSLSGCGVSWTAMPR